MTTDRVELGEVSFKENSMSTEFILKLASGEYRRVIYSERKLPDGTVGFFGMELELGGELEGNIFREGSNYSVGAVFAKQRGRSLPYGMSLGDAIRKRYGKELIEAFTEFLKSEGYSYASILWEDALATGE
jgi:hypothetical protein